MSLLTCLVVVLFFGGALSAIYYALVRPSLIFFLRRRAIAVQDELKLAVLKGSIGSHEKAVEPTFRKLRALIKGCDKVGIVGIACALIEEPSINLEADRDEQIAKNAGAMMKDIIRRADMLLICCLLTNSPFFWFVLPPIYIVGTLNGRISRWINSLSLATHGGQDREHDQDHDHHGIVLA